MEYCLVLSTPFGLKVESTLLVPHYCQIANKHKLVYRKQTSKADANNKKINCQMVERNIDKEYQAPILMINISASNSMAFQRMTAGKQILYA